MATDTWRCPMTFGETRLPLTKHYPIHKDHTFDDYAETKALENASVQLWHRISVKIEDNVDAPFICSLLKETRTGFITGPFAISVMNGISNSTRQIDIVLDIEEERETNFLFFLYKELKVKATSHITNPTSNELLMRVSFFNWLKMYNRCADTATFRETLLRKTPKDRNAIKQAMDSILQCPTGLHTAALVTFHLPCARLTKYIHVHLTRFKNIRDQKMHAFYWQMSQPLEAMRLCLFHCAMIVDWFTALTFAPNRPLDIKHFGDIHYYSRPIWGIDRNYCGSRLLARDINMPWAELKRLAKAQTSPSSLLEIAYTVAIDASPRRKIQIALYKTITTLATETEAEPSSTLLHLIFGHEIRIPFRPERIKFMAWHTTYKPTWLEKQVNDIPQTVTKCKGVTTLSLFSAR